MKIQTVSRRGGKLVAPCLCKERKSRVLPILETGGYDMTELRRTNVIGVLRNGRAQIARRSQVSVPGNDFKDAGPDASGVGFAVGPPR